MNKMAIGAAFGFILGAISLPPLSRSATISRVYTFTDGSILTASQLNTEFNNLVNGANSLDDNNLSDSANISPAKINASIAGNAITRDGSTGVLSISAGAISSNELGSNSVTTAKITDSNVTTAKIADSNVTTAKIEDNAITTSKITDSSVIEGKILNGAVTQVKIANDSVGTSQLINLNVTGAKIAANTITNAKITSSTTSQQSGTISGTISGTTSTMTGSAITIVSQGRPINVSLSAITAATPSSVLISGGGCYIAFFRDDGGGYNEVARIGGSNTMPPGSFSFLDFPPAGSHNYQAQASCGGTLTWTNVRLVAFETL